MNPMFKNTKKVILPIVLKYPFEMGDEEFHPIDARNHYQEILVKVFGEKGYEMAVVDIMFKGNFLVLEVI